MFWNPGGTIYDRNNYIYSESYTTEEDEIPKLR